MSDSPPDMPRSYTEAVLRHIKLLALGVLGGLSTGIGTSGVDVLKWSRRSVLDAVAVLAVAVMVAQWKAWRDLRSIVEARDRTIAGLERAMSDVEGVARVQAEDAIVRSKQRDALAEFIAAGVRLQQMEPSETEDTFAPTGNPFMLTYEQACRHWPQAVRGWWGKVEPWLAEHAPPGDASRVASLSSVLRGEPGEAQSLSERRQSGVDTLARGLAYLTERVEALR